MKNVTITIFVTQNSLLNLLTTLKILDDLNFENEFRVQRPDSFECTDSIIFKI